MKREITTDDKVVSAKRPKGTLEDDPAPDMSLLHAPTKKGWGKDEWNLWKEAMNKSCREIENWDQYWEQFHAAKIWAAPDAVTLKLSTSEPNKSGEFHISKEGNDTWRSVINEFCAKEGINRDHYEWSLDDEKEYLNYDSFNQVEIMCFDKCYDKIWNPIGKVSRFSEDGTTYSAKITGRKISPPRPSSPPEKPSFALFKSPPPEGNAPRNEWKAWLKENQTGPGQFEEAKEVAIQYRCPRKIGISLKGVSHNIELSGFDADTPLSVALEKYCSSVPQGELIPADVLLKEGPVGSKETVESWRTPRSFFDGTTLNFCFEVVYKDWDRLAAEIDAKRPEENHCPFYGSDHLLSETDQPWIVKQDGLDTYNQILEASRCYDKPSNYRGWCEMMEELLQILGSIARKPRSGWTVETVTVEMEKLTAAILFLNEHRDWSRRDQNRVQDGGVKILRKIDACSLKLIKETVELTWDSSTANAFHQSDGVFGIKDTVGQLKRLMIKCKESCWFVNDFKELDIFSRALRLVDSV